ncbi:hydrogenase expression protein HupH [Rhizobiales bacterium RZME27]|uniref:Hydrogenase expression protein HupH n=1 Tax=Endobacterium cereale TaxID=2663029 RepID=A0A6A8A313_9HYPH|nr:aspartate/glutamate racemase family protein [Endobacterium cereale]MEB2844565.1 aspartate/glutamate racemase family protein [Endobacterium cereale]MQY45119.1 hydrogenase expression protein HupH [Endobacterium cereale]
MAKVLVIVPFPMDDDNLSKRRAPLNAVRLGDGIDFDFKPVRIAPANYVSQQDSVLADIGILQAGLQAQADGYDAVCIDTMSDSGMSALRSVLDIPVIGPGRHAMLTALMLGEKFSILAMWDRWRHLYTKTLAELGLSHKCASLRSAGLQSNNQSLLAGKEEEFFPALYEAAMKCVQVDGADVIILGSTTMHEAHAYLAERLPVPIINPGPLTYRLADAAIKLKLSHGRSSYPAPSHIATEKLAAMGDIAARLAGVSR